MNSAVESSSIGTRWAVFALVSALCHHIGPLFGPLGDVFEGARYADFVDIVTPFAVVGLAVRVLFAVPEVSRTTWVVFGMIAVAYVEGHGIHLAANSVHNQGPTGNALVTTYFWDEEFGHILWFGAYPLLTALLALVSRRVVAPFTVLRGVAAVVFGFAFMTTSVEGHMVPVAMVTSVVLIVFGLRNRDGLGRDLLLAFSTCAVLLAVFGIWQGGFPEFSQLGWI